MKSKKNTIEITEQEILKPVEVIEPEPEPESEPIKQKEVNLVPPTPTAYAAPTFKLPSSMGSKLWSGGRF